MEEFLYSRSCAVIFASTDSEHCLKAWNGTSETEGGLGGVHVPLVSDCNHQLSRDYGVLIEEQGVAQRALFIIDPKGVVRSITVNDAEVGRSVDEAQRVLDALAFKDEFGEGCPVDWKKGDKGIELASPSQTEGQLQLKKSWSGWARPKLQRAWSGASQRSISSMMSGSRVDLTTPIDTGNAGKTPYHATFASAGSAQHSPLLSPTSTPVFLKNWHLSSGHSMQSQMEEAIVQQQQRLDNLQASMQNQGVGVSN